MQQAVQVAFVFDSKSAVSDTAWRIGSLYLTCSRILLSLSGFPNGTRMKCFKWKYVFFNQSEPALTRVPQFMELRSTCIENMVKELRWELQTNVGDTQTRQITMSMLSSVLTDLVQGSTWDSPDILSPPLVSGKEARKFAVENEPLNMVFVFSDCPRHADQLAGNLFANDLFTCLLKQNISIFWLYEGDYDEALRRAFEVVGPTGGSIMRLSSYIEPIPSLSLLPILQAVVEGPQGKGYRKQLATSRVTRQNIGSGFTDSPVHTEYFWLGNKDHTLCIIEVEPLYKSVWGKSLITSINRFGCSVGLPDEQSQGYANSNQGHEECSFSANHAVIIGVIRQSDVPYSWMQPYLSFSSIGLSVPFAKLGKSPWLQQTPESVLQGSRTFSKEYQNMCGKLAKNRTLLLLEVNSSAGDAGMCVLQPLSSVMCSLSVLQPQPSVLASLCLNRHTLKTHSKPGDQSVHNISVVEQQGNPFHGERFTSDSLLLWYPFVQNHGVSISSVERLNKLQMKDRNRCLRQNNFRKLLNIVSSHPQTNKEKTEVLIKADQVTTAKSDDAGVSQECVGAPIEETLVIVQASYNQQVQHSVECSILQEWVSSYMLKLQQNLNREHLFSTVYESLLLTPEQLDNKYAKEVQHDKMTEYQLQVLLRLELHHICAIHISEAEFIVLASQVTDLLRKISLLAKPSFLAHCMKEVIIPRYSSSCKRMLLTVYEELMLPVPAELGGSPSSSPHDLCVEDTSNSQVNLLLQENPSVQPVTAARRSLVRRASFQDQRQITVPAQKQKVKKEVKESTAFTRNKDFHGAGNSTNESKKVCRTLFNRSMSLTTGIGCKRHRVEEDSNTTSKRNRGEFVVKETPVKKQVEDYRRFKLQRLRSKMDGNEYEQVAVIEESPRRSFYSSKHPAVTSSFQHFSKKRPSPTAMKTLLQGTIVHERDKPTTTIASSRNNIFTTSASRVLAYEEEDPLIHGQQPTVKSPPSCLLLSSNLPDTVPYPMTDIEPFVSGESASMVAFSLSTPTKDDPLTFQHALEQ